MKISYDKQEDVLKIVFRDVPITESDEEKPGFILDYDETGNLVALEIMQASKRTDDPKRITSGTKNFSLSA